MHVEICDVSCLIVKTVKTQKQVKYKKKEEGATIRHELPVDGKQETEGRRENLEVHTAQTAEESRKDHQICTLKMGTQTTAQGLHHQAI